MSQYAGIIANFEGLDFSGKTTQMTIFFEKFGKEKHALGYDGPVHVVREPGGTAISERVRDLLLDRKNLEMTDTAEVFLFNASRAQLVSEVVQPAVGRGEIVILDRYYDSTTAYQGYGRGVDLKAIAAINKLATRGLVPDITYLVDIPVDEIEKRKHRAGLQFDRIEASGRAFYERVRNGYLKMAENEPERFRVIDGTKTVDKIADYVFQEFSALMKAKKLQSEKVDI